MQQVVHRHLQHPALDVPQRQIDGALPVDLLPARRIKAVHVHVLPQLLDLERIPADDASGEITDEIRRAAFANAGDPDVGFHRHQQATLIEGPVHARMRPALHARDAGLRERRIRPPRRNQRGTGACGKRLEQRSAIHHGVALSRLGTEGTEGKEAFRVANGGYRGNGITQRNGGTETNREDQ